MIESYHFKPKGKNPDDRNVQELNVQELQGRGELKETPQKPEILKISRLAPDQKDVAAVGHFVALESSSEDLVALKNKLLDKFSEDEDAQSFDSDGEDNKYLADNNELSSVPHAVSNPGVMLNQAHSSQAQVLNDRAAVFSAVASGQEEAKNQVWMSGFFGNNSDKSVATATSKNNFIGGSIGYDHFVTDTTAIGASLTLIKGVTKFSSNEKTKSSTYIGSIYSFTNIDDILLSGMVFAGFGNAKNSRTVASINYSAKVKNFLYGAKAEVGYRIQNDNHVFTPSVGLSYVGIRQGKYNEFADGQETTRYRTRKSSSLVGSAAVKYEYLIQSEQTTIVPSLKLGLSRDLVLNHSKVKYRVDGQPDAAFPIRCDGKRKTTVFATPALSVKKDNFDFSVSYTMEQAKKYKSNLVTLKLIGKF